MNINFEKIARTFLYILAFLLPIFNLSGVATIDVNKEVFLGIFCILIFVFLALAAIKNGKIYLKKSKLSLGVGLFLLASLVSTTFSSNFVNSFWGDITYADSFFSIILYCTVFFFGATLLKEKKHLKKVLYSILAGISVLSLMFIFTGNACGLGLGLASILFSIGVLITLNLICNTEKSRFKALGYVNFLILIISLFIINFNIAWFLLAIGSFLLFWSKFNNKKSLKRGYFLPILLTIISIVLFFGNFNFGSDVLKEGLNLKASTTLVSDSFKNPQNLFIGEGPSGFDESFLLYKDSSLNSIDLENVVFYQSSSGIITILNNLGVVGLSIFILIFASLIFTGIKQIMINKNEFNHLYFILTFVLFLALFFCQINLILMFFLFLFLGIFVQNNSKSIEIDIKNKNSKKIFIFIFILSSLVLLGIVMLYSLSMQYISEYNYSNALKTFQNDKDQAVILLNKANEYNAESENYVLLSQIYLFKSGDSYEKSRDLYLDEEKRLGEVENVEFYINEAEKNAILAVERDGSYESYMNLGNIYLNKTYAISEDFSGKALEAYNQAIILAPNNTAPYLNIYKIYLELGDNVKTEEYLNKLKGIDLDFNL